MITFLQRILWWGLPSLLIILSLFTQNNRSVDGDEFSMFWSAQQTPETIISLYLSPRENNPPGIALIQHYWGLAFGYSVTSLRFLSLIIAALAIPVLWKVVEYFSGECSHQQRRGIFLLAVTTPVWWMSANFARYQPFVLLLGLWSLYGYVQWHSKRQQRWLVSYGISIASLFYLHYLPAAVLALCLGLHYLWYSAQQKQVFTRSFWVWAAVQCSILLFISPLLYSILNASSTIDLTRGTSNKILSTPIFISATFYGIINGFVVPPWWFWLTLPSLLVFGILILRSAHKDILFNPDGVFFIILPLILMAGIFAKMYPITPVYLFPSIQRLAYIAPLFWIFLGKTLYSRISRKFQLWFVVIILLSNSYAIFIWNINLPAIQHTKPIIELVSTVRQHTPDSTKTLVIHSIGYGYSLYGVGLIDSTTATPVSLALPGYTTRVLNETDIGFTITPDSCRRMIEACLPQYVWILQRNRYPTNARTFAQVLLNSGYIKISEQFLQEQTEYDRWIKTLLLRFPLPGFKDDPPQQYLYTLQHFKKSEPRR